MSQAGVNLERLRLLCVLLGIALTVVVFIIAVSFFYTYERVHLGGDLASNISGLASEALYLLGKAVFLGVALLAGAQLLKYGLRTQESKGGGTA